jgi:UDP-2,4-diacetamido-2,4,6-trideoxy-beta-L-altropyranose hydrolase
MPAAPLNVLFRVAAGPQVGFGHLARSRSLARALDVARFVSVRGSLRTRSAAAALGWQLADDTSDGHLDSLGLDLIVVDDPRQDEASFWVRKARRIGVPVASVHDLGHAIVDSDLVIDGSITPVASDIGMPALRGPGFAILDPSIARVRAESRHPVFGRVLIALGGGIHVYPIASKLTRALVARMPALDIHVACGFAPPRTLPSLTRGSWIASPDGLGSELAAATVAVVAGGVTLYEACALRVPVVALPVTAAQHAATRAFACRGAVIDGGWPLDDAAIERVADAVANLFENTRARQKLSAEAGRLIDGDGVFRVGDRLRLLAQQGREAMHAA